MPNILPSLFHLLLIAARVKKTLTTRVSGEDILTKIIQLSGGF